MVISMDRWKGKLAIVTGASSGIGEAISEQLVANGIIVVGVARRIDLMTAKAKHLNTRPNGGQFHPFKADLTVEQDIASLFKWVTQTLGPVHILVNNAGMWLNNDTLHSGDPKSWRKLFDLNIMSLCIATKEALRIMQEHRIDGHIFHMNSIVGHHVPDFKGLSVYPASKHAVTALAETLRFELNSLRSKIKITSISPGVVESEMTTLDPGAGEERRAFFEASGVLKCEDIADGVIYALSTPRHVLVKELIIKPVGEMV